MVHGMHFRHPAVTAKMASTLDIVSGGRLNVGLGVGWFQPEVDAHGLQLGIVTVAQRLDRFGRGAHIMTPSDANPRNWPPRQHFYSKPV